MALKAGIAISRFISIWPGTDRHKVFQYTASHAQKQYERDQSILEYCSFCNQFKGVKPKGARSG
ncbi:MAG TPA: hypothetical protein VF665_15780 [Longimicrobium sp.]|uniref:hypothetical protein n=1 Tax=Longimicrobium sp. TaxID=2029185 RepID=UPI002ED8CE9E